MLIASAVHHHIDAAFFNDMTIGMICDILSEFIPEEQQIRQATQADIDRL